MDERSERIQRRFEGPVLAAALLVIPVIVVEETSPGQPWETAASVTNWAIWLLFLAEVVTMLAIVPSRRAWLRDHVLDVAIVALTPPVLPASMQAARVFRLARLLRLARGFVAIRRLFTPEGVRYAAITSAFLVLLGGVRSPQSRRTSTCRRGMGSIGPSARSRPPATPTSARPPTAAESLPSPS